MKRLLIGALAMATAITVNATDMTAEWDKTFPKSEKVEHSKAILGGNARRLFGREPKSQAIFRIAEIEVKPDFLGAYLAAAAKVGATSVHEEPGVLCIFPMQDAEKPTSIRILEIYRDEAAYKAHLATPHFRTYKEGTPHMIESLRLAPMRPLDPSLPYDVFLKIHTSQKESQP